MASIIEQADKSARDILSSVLYGEGEEFPLDFDDDGDREQVSEAVKDLRVPEDRQGLYKDYEKLEKEGIPSNVLETYTDDTVGHKIESGRRIWVTAEKKSVAKEANKKLDEWGVRQNLWDLTYFSLLFGDYFLFFEFDEEEGGIENVRFDLHPKVFKRFEKSNKLAGFQIDGDVDDRSHHKFRRKNKIELVEPFKVVHIRLGTSTNQLKTTLNQDIVEGRYGSSIFQSTLADLKKLNMAENSLVISRYQKQRRPALLFIDVANHINGSEKQKRLYKMVRNKVKSDPSFDTESGNYNSLSELFSHSEIKTLPHDPSMIEFRDLSEQASVESIADVEHLHERAIANFKVPSAFLGLEDKLPQGIGESSLISISTRYARSVRRIQADIISPLKRMLRIHFGSKGDFVSSEDIQVHTQSITTAEDLTDAERANKIASSFSQITQLFGRGPLEDVDLDQEGFAEFIISSLGIPELEPDDILDIEDQSEETDTEVMEEIDKFLGGSCHPDSSDEIQVPEEGLHTAREKWIERIRT